jgi:hypothetical protein
VTIIGQADAGASGPTWGGGVSGCPAGPTCTITLSDDVNGMVTFAPHATHHLSVTVVGSGQLTGDPTGLTCSPPADQPKICTGSFDADTTVQLTATPADGWTDPVWSGDSACATQTCSIEMSGDTWVTVTFAPPKVTKNVTVTVQGSGTLTGDLEEFACVLNLNQTSTCKGSVEGGATVTLSASPATGWTGPVWTGDGACDQPSCQLQATNDITATATFAAVPVTKTVTVIVSGAGTLNGDLAGLSCIDNGDGTRICSGNFPENKVVGFDGSPAPGNSGPTWTGNAVWVDQAACPGPQCRAVVSQNIIETATFTVVHKTLSLTVGGAGSVTGPGNFSCTSTTSPCTLTQDQFASATLQAWTPIGWNSPSWSGPCDGFATSCGVQFNDDMTATAIFTVVKKRLTVTVVGSGTVSSSPSGLSCSEGNSPCWFDFNQGTEVGLTANPGPGFNGPTWVGAGCGGRSCVLSMDDAVSVNTIYSDQGGVAPGKSKSVNTNLFGRTRVCVRNLDEHNDATFTALSGPTFIPRTVVGPNSEDCSTLHGAWAAFNVEVFNISASAHIDVTKP